MNPKSDEYDTFPPLKHHIENALNQLERHLASTSGRKKLSTGILKLDTAIQHLRSGKLYILAGHPTSGRDILLCKILKHVVIHENAPTLFFSFAWSGSQIIERVLYLDNPVPLVSDSQNPSLKNSLTKIKECCRELSNSPLHIIDNSDRSIHTIKAKSRKLAHDLNLEFIVVDYLQLITSKCDKTREHGYVVAELKALAIELDVPILLTAYMQYDDTNNSGSMSLTTAQDLEMVMNISDAFCSLPHPLHFFESPFEENGHPKILVIKNGAQQKVTVPLKYNETTWSFEEYIGGAPS